MKGRWKLGEPFGIGVYLHWTFAIIVVLLMLSGFGLPLIVAIFGSVLLHELGHSLAARRYGIGTRDITLYPIGGVASLERMPKSPLQELVIALAGPAVNLVIFCLLFPLAFILGTVSFPLAEFLSTVATVNVVLMLFNLLPAFPMDGGRVLRALLALKKGRVEATNIAAKVGKVMAVFMGLYGLFYPGGPLLMLIFVAIFVWFAGESERMVVEAEALPQESPNGFGRFGPFFYYGNDPIPRQQRESYQHQGAAPPARDADWEVLPPETGNHHARFGSHS